MAEFLITRKGPLAPVLGPRSRPSTPIGQAVRFSGFPDHGLVFLNEPVDGRLGGPSTLDRSIPNSNEIVQRRFRYHLLSTYADDNSCEA